MYEVEVYIEEDGASPFAAWFSRLPAAVANRVDTTLRRMRAGNLGDHRSVGGGVLEARLHLGPGFRLYFGRDGERLIVLLVGGSKRTQRRDIQAARRLWRRYMERRREREWP